MGRFLKRIKDLVERSPQRAYNFYWSVFGKTERSSYQAHAFYNLAFLNLLYQAEIKQETKEKAYALLENAEKLEKRSRMPVTMLKFYLKMKQVSFVEFIGYLKNYLWSFWEFNNLRTFTIWGVAGTFALFVVLLSCGNAN